MNFPFHPEFVLAALKLWKWIIVQSYLEMTSMGFVVESSCLIFLLGICAVDTTTLCLEVRGQCDLLCVMRDEEIWFASQDVSCFHVISFLSFSRPQRSSKLYSKSYDPTLLSEENISYKNPYSSFLSKTTFWWMTSLLWKGFNKPLELFDLGNLAEDDTSRYHYDQFLFIYQSFKVKKNVSFLLLR